MRNTAPTLKKKKSGWFDHVTNARYTDNYRLRFVIWTNAPFLLHIIGLDRYYNFIFAGRKISREEYFAGGKFREIPIAVDIIFAGGKFRAKSKFANIAKISSTRKIGVIQYAYIAHIMNVTQYRLVYYVGFSLPSCKVGHINKFD